MWPQAEPTVTGATSPRTVAKFPMINTRYGEDDRHFSVVTLPATAAAATAPSSTLASVLGRPYGRAASSMTATAAVIRSAAAATTLAAIQTGSRSGLSHLHASNWQWDRLAKMLQVVQATKGNNGRDSRNDHRQRASPGPTPICGPDNDGGHGQQRCDREL